MKRETLGEVYLNRRMAVLTGLGFASGLPLVLTGDTLAAWLSSLGVKVSAIGLFSLVALPYTLKFLWAPLMDRYRVPPFGRRRGWLAVTQCVLIALLVGMAAAGPEAPHESLHVLAVVATLVAFVSASQDIVADAFRTDVLPRQELGAGAAVFVTGYRVAMIAAGSLAMMVAQRYGWRAAYGLMAAGMLVGLVATLAAPEPAGAQPPASLAEAVIHPFVAFLRRNGRLALVVLAFVVLFRLPDVTAGAMTMPLLLNELKYSPDQVGLARQLVGFFIVIVGALAGGGVVAKLGMMRSLWLFGTLQALSNGGFFVLAKLGPVPAAVEAGGDTWTARAAALVAVIGVESFCGGLVTAGFTAYLMSQCDKRYSAFQYALLTSLMALTRALGGAMTGYLVEAVGYAWFFLMTIGLGVPGMALLPFLTERRGGDPNARPCPACGYDLRGVTDGACPECGASIGSDATQMAVDANLASRHQGPAAAGA